MSLNVKYQYTHFIYPFVVERSEYTNFLSSILSQEKDWSLYVHNYETDKESYDFFLPYMKRFLFPTLFWNLDYEKQFKAMSLSKKVYNISKLSCITFDYQLSSIKTGSVELGRRFGEINFDISSIRLIVFKGGICFLDIKTEIEEPREYIDFNKLLDFNNSFRKLTPRGIGSLSKLTKMKARNIDKIENIAIFIKSIISGFETKDIEKMYYDKMFTYSYACVDDWKKENDFDTMKNDFLKFQYVMSSKSSAIFNKNCTTLYENMYSRWQYSMFGFSKESGVVLVSEREKYNITKMPYNFEKKYLYMLLLALYQRITLMNFSQDLAKKDKSMARSLTNRFTKFTHFSWFSEITNSENGMEIWENWVKAFKLKELFDEVHKEYIEYYDFVKSTGQERFNLVIMLTYVVNIAFSGISLFANLFNFREHWLAPVILALMVTAMSSYPIFLISRWIKHKIENKMDNDI